MYIYTHIYICIYSKKYINQKYLLKEKQKPVWSGKSQAEERKKEKENALNRPTSIEDFESDFIVFKKTYTLYVKQTIPQKTKEKSLPKFYYETVFHGTKMANIQENDLESHL